MTRTTILNHGSTNPQGTYISRVLFRMRNEKGMNKSDCGMEIDHICTPPFIFLKLRFFKSSERIYEKGDGPNHEKRHVMAF